MLHLLIKTANNAMSKEKPTPIKQSDTFVRRLHRWLALFVGLQLLLWTGTGVYMTSIDIDIIHGDHLVKQKKFPSLKSANYDELRTPPSLPETEEITFQHWLSRPVYKIRTSQNERLYDAKTGYPIKIVQEHIRLLAIGHYKGSGSIINIEFLRKAPDEVKALRGPLWRVDFDDRFHPSFYFDADTGELKKVRTDLWRLFDVFWRLHIMDYSGEDNVNNWLLTYASVVALIGLFYGVWLVKSTIRIPIGESANSTLRFLHRWVGIIVGIQLIMWVVSGFMFNTLPHQDVRGTHLVEPLKPAEFPLNTDYFREIAVKDKNATHISLMQTHQGPVAKVHSGFKDYYITLRTMTEISLTKAQIQRIALKAFAADGKIIDTYLDKTRKTDTQKLPLPVWRVIFNDELNTNVFYHPATGELLAVKTDTWRIHDFFWMLHTMDYKSRSDFNNPLVITAASLALFLTLSGLIMLGTSFDFNAIRQFRNGRQSERLVRIQTAVGHKRLVNINSKVTLYEGLMEQEVELPSSCGGNGGCGQCKVRFIDPIPKITVADRKMLSDVELTQGYRLACQVTAQDQQEIEVDAQVLTQQTLECRVISNNFVTPFIKELILEPPYGSDFTFEAGEHIMVHCPPHTTPLLAIDLPTHIESTWKVKGLLEHTSVAEREETRLYSMANPPQENRRLMFNIRLAEPKGDFPPGKVSPFLFALRPNDIVEVSGPFGDFHSDDTNNEYVFVAGGAGMAPIRSHLLDLLAHKKQTNKISFWYGARSEKELYYDDEMQQLAEEFDNFTWHVSLSEQAPLEWQGYIGYIHQVVYDNYIVHHKNLPKVTFFLCGPPQLINAMKVLLRSARVTNSQIKVDDFGQHQ